MSNAVQRPDSVTKWMEYEREKIKKTARLPTYMIKQMGPLYQGGMVKRGMFKKEDKKSFLPAILSLMCLQDIQVASQRIISLPGGKEIRDHGPQFM